MEPPKNDKALKENYLSTLAVKIFKMHTNKLFVFVLLCYGLQDHNITTVIPIIKVD